MSCEQCGFRHFPDWIWSQQTKEQKKKKFQTFLKIKFKKKAKKHRTSLNYGPKLN